MFIAMNRFRVVKGSEDAFEKVWLSREKVWLSRDSHLDTVPGFVEFRLLKGPEGEDHTRYASHTVWESRTEFEAWTRSEAFRAAHHGEVTFCVVFIRHNFCNSSIQTPPSDATLGGLYSRTLQDAWRCIRKAFEGP